MGATAVHAATSFCNTTIVQDSDKELAHVNSPSLCSLVVQGRCHLQKKTFRLSLRSVLPCLARLSKASPLDVVTSPRPWSRLVSNAPAFDWQLYESYDWVAIHTSEDAYETTVQRTRNRHGCGDAGHPGGGMY